MVGRWLWLKLVAITQLEPSVDFVYSACLSLSLSLPSSVDSLSLSLHECFLLHLPHWNLRVCCCYHRRRVRGKTVNCVYGWQYFFWCKETRMRYTHTDTRHVCVCVYFTEKKILKKDEEHSNDSRTTELGNEQRERERALDEKQFNWQ